MNRIGLLLTIPCFLCCLYLHAQDVIFSEDFLTGTQYTVTLGTESSNGNNNYFLRTDGNDINLTYTGVVGFFFAAQDIDDAGTGSTNPAQLTWSGINVANYTNLSFSGLFGSLTGSADASDYVLVEYQLDNGGWQNLLAFENSTDDFNDMFYEDTDFDGTGDGTLLTGALATFSKNIPDGDILDFRITASLNAGSEDIAFDELKIEGTLSSSETISTQNVTGPFCVDATNVANVDVNYTTTGTFAGTFTAQLSDANGDFTTPTDIGTDAEPDGIINAVIPANTPSGTGYKIRVVNDNPTTEGTATADFEIINGVPEVSMEIGTGGDMQATIDWSNPNSCFDAILVVANETMGIDFAPTGDGMQYSVNTDYTTGADAVFLGTGTTVTVTGLTNETTYYFEIFVRKGTEWSTGVEVSATPDVPPTCEDFTNYNQTGSTYANGTFPGLDGSTWSYNQCNAAESINTPSPLLGKDRTPLADVTSGTISGGLGTLTFDYMQAFGSDVNLEIYVNDNLVGNVTSDNEEDIVKQANILVEVAGNFTLSFRQPNISAGQVVIDNVCWTTHELGGCVEPSAPTTLTLTPDAEQIEGTLTGDADGYLVIMSTDMTLDMPPTDGTTYAVNDMLGADIVVHEGSLAEFLVSGLMPSSTYYFFAFQYDANCIGEPTYSSVSLDENTTTLPPQNDCFIDNCNFTIVPVTQNAQNDNWSCNNGSYFVNGSCSNCGEPSDLWLVSPPFNFGNNALRRLKMDILDVFGASTINVVWSANYAGNPATATWNPITSLTADFNSNTTNILEDITHLNGNNPVYIGIQYVADGQNGTGAFEVSNIVIQSEDCNETETLCSISALELTNFVPCDDNASPDNTTDDFFTADVIVTFVSPPATGNLTLSGSVLGTGDPLSAPIGTSPQTFTNIRFPADGNTISLTATFDDQDACTFTDATILSGVQPCPPATVPWKETFDISDEGVQGPCANSDIMSCDSDNSPLNGQWSVIGDMSALMGTNNYLETRNGVLEGSNTVVPICFLSQPIDIAGKTVDLVVDVTEVGDIEQDDYVTVSYIVDNNPTTITNWMGLGDINFTLIGDIPDDNDWGTTTVEANEIGGGDDLQIEICIVNDANSERIQIDNVCVVESPCRISDISITNVGTCNSNVANDVNDDFYTADVTVTFVTPETTGTLDLTGDIVGTPPSVDVATLAGTFSYTFTGVQLKADGTGTDLMAAFSDNINCTYSETDVDAGMSPCCIIEAVTVGNTSACDNNMTTNETGDDTFTTEVTVTFYSQPTTGTLDLSGDVTASINVSEAIMGDPNSHTFMLTLPANGLDFNVTANFSEDVNCSGITMITGVASCSENTPTLNGGLLVNELAEQPASFSDFLVNDPEFIEFLVIGEAANPDLNVNIEGWIFDDNSTDANEFGDTGDTGGFYRIKPGSDCLTDVPAGSLVVIYNADNPPPGMPADDETDSNMDNVYILPSNSTCLEISTASVTDVSTGYTTATFEAPNTLSWTNELEFRNGGDVVQTRKPDGTFYHGYGYGTVTGPYPNFPNGNPSFTLPIVNANDLSIFYSCGNSTDEGEFTGATSFTPGEANNTDNQTLIDALLQGTADYNSLIGTNMTSSCAVLPLEWLSFSAILENNQVHLQWQTAFEKDSDHFEIQHSTDGHFYKKIGLQSSKGQPNSIQSYEYFHQNPQPGNNYYRLRQIDVNGAFSYSPTVQVFYEKNTADILVYPIPSKDLVYIDFGKNTNFAKTVQLIDVQGRLLREWKVDETISPLEINLTDLESGMYWLKMVVNEGVLVKKILIE